MPSPNTRLDGSSLRGVGQVVGTAPSSLGLIDADNTSYAAYFDAVLPLVRKGGLIIADNTLWSGTVVDPKPDDARAMVAFNAKVAADPRVAKVLLTVRDGMLFPQKVRRPGRCCRRIG